VTDHKVSNIVATLAATCLLLTIAIGLRDGEWSSLLYVPLAIVNLGILVTNDGPIIQRKRSR
jgi:hypothetical protein